MISGVLSVVLSVILITEVVIPTVKTANTTAFSTAELAIWSLITLIAIFGLVYGVGAVFGVF